MAKKEILKSLNENSKINLDSIINIEKYEYFQDKNENYQYGESRTRLTIDANGEHVWEESVIKFFERVMIDECSMWEIYKDLIEEDFNRESESKSHVCYIVDTKSKEDLEDMISSLQSLLKDLKSSKKIEK